MITQSRTLDEDFGRSEGSLGVAGAEFEEAGFGVESIEMTGVESIEENDIVGTGGMIMRVEALLAGAFLATAFLAATFFAGAFFAAAFLAATFFAGAFFTATFFETAFFATAFFTATFFETAFFATAFFTATFLAGAFFAADFFAVFLTATGDSSVGCASNSGQRGRTNTKIVP
jgi:hypothetical protein